MYIMFKKPILNIGYNKQYLEHLNRFTGYYGNLVNGIVGDDKFNELCTLKGVSTALINNKQIGLPIYYEPCDDPKSFVTFAVLHQLRLDAYDTPSISQLIVEVLHINKLDVYLDSIFKVYCSKEKIDKIMQDHDAVLKTLTTIEIIDTFKTLIISIWIKDNLDFDMRYLHNDLCNRINQMIDIKIMNYLNNYD